MNISFRRSQLKPNKAPESSDSMSDEAEIEMPGRPAQERSETFAEKLPKLKESRERLRKFIELRDPNEQYSLDLKKYDHSIIDPRLLHVKINRDILELADSSIKKMNVNKKVKKNWSKEDIIILVWLIDKYGKNPDDYEQADWKAVAQLIPGKDHQQAMFKWMSLRNTRKSTQKREWVSSEEKHLKEIVERLGNKSWFEVSKQLYHCEGKRLKIYRSPKHCRERWACYLDPKVKKGPWKPSEDIVLLKEFLTIGKKWSHIAKKLNGRTENAIKNRFTLLLDKKAALYKNNKNAISDELYIKNMIQNLEVGLFITTNDQLPVEQQVDEDNVQVRSEPGQNAEYTVKEQTPLGREPLRRSYTLNDVMMQSGRPLQQKEIQHCDYAQPMGRRPVTVKVERMSMELLLELRKGGIRPAVLNSAASELYFKDEATSDISYKDHREMEVSEDYMIPNMNIELHSESDFEYFCRAADDIILQ